MAEVIGFNIVANLLIRMGEIPFREFCLVYGVGDELGKLKDTLSTIEAALLDADQRKEKSHLMQDWIRKLKDAVYDADDVLDAFATKALQRELDTTDGRIKRQVREFFSTSNQLYFRYMLGHKIKEMRERFNEIAANMSKFNYTERLIVQASFDNSYRESVSVVSTPGVIGREKDKEEILKLIMSTRSNKENVAVITIVGMGGLGKTALTQLVYNDDKVVKYFKLRSWVCVSEDFEKKSIVKKILKSVTNNEVGDLELEQLQIRLRESLWGKRFLLVLDDIWNENPQKWELVKKLLMDGAKGSKIVVTTHSRTVASVMGTENPYILKGLSYEQSCTLFEMVAFGGHKTVHSNLVLIGKEITGKCKGVPLAIRSLASVMHSKTQESQWLSIRNNHVWSLCQDDGNILHILKLSYDYLSVQLKQCFAYCSIFPKDYEIQKEVLIQLWMAQGYIQSPDSIQCLEDIGDQYFSNLSSSSFFQDAKVNDYNEVISCKMHDLIHDLAIRVAGSDCAIAKTYEDNISDRVHHVSIVYPFKELPRQMLKAKGLRTFLQTCDYSCRASISRILMSPNLTCLRVLDVHSRGVRKVPNSIDKLQHLRYLDLSDNRPMTGLPNSIRKLVNLQTLKLSSCNYLKRLPEGITKLINVRYLEIDGCSSLKYMPTGMGKLTSFRTLNKFVVGGNNRSLRLSELNGLNELKGDISIKSLENVKDGRSEATEAKLTIKQYVHSLTLEWGIGYRRVGGSSQNDGNMDEVLLEGLQPHPKLRELRIDGYLGMMFPSWMRTGNILISLPNIVRITLYYCERCQHLPPSLDKLPFLEFLTLHGLKRVEHINNDDDDSNNPVERKSSTSSVFFPSLEELDIVGLANLKGWWRASETGEEGERASEWSQRPSFPRLTKLKISECPTLTSMPMIPPHLEKLHLNIVPEKLVLQLLLTTTTTTSTSATTAITEGSISSSSSSSIPTAIISSKLKSLRISSIQDLESLPVEVFRNLASLETLEICSCPRLSLCFAVSNEEGFRGLSSLRSLHDPTIYDCTYNFDLCGDHGVHWQGLKSLRNLDLGHIPKLVSLPVGLQHVTTLQRLDIIDCPGLMGLPNWLSNLTSLQSLDIFYCPLLSERCREETGEDWPNISHIPTIRIDYNFIQRRRG